MSGSAPTSLAFRDIADHDVAEVVALWEAAGLTRPWNDPARDIAFARRNPNSSVLVSRDGEGRLAAAVMLGHDGHRGWAYYLATDPARLRQGCGRQAMAAAEDWLRRRGVWKINLMVRNGNEAALGFYAALGYHDQQCVVLGRYLDGRDHREPPGPEREAG